MFHILSQSALKILDFAHYECATMHSEEGKVRMNFLAWLRLGAGDQA